MSEQAQAAPGGPGRAGHPELEELAALIDGRLPTAEAARMRTHLASCEDCYEVFAETLHLQEELRGEEESGGDVVPFPFEGRRKVRPWRAAAAAALLVAGVGGGLWWTRDTRGAVTDFSIAGLATPLSSQFRDVGRVAWGERTRGEGTGEERGLSFQVGVEALNLQLALEAGDRTAADSATAKLNGLFQKPAFLDNGIQDFYKGLRSDIDKVKTPQSLAPRAAVEANALRRSVSFERPELDLGAWAEAGRLAALSKQPVPSRREEAAYLLEQFKKDKDADLPREVRTMLEAIQKRPATDYPGLKTGFEKILAYYYPQGRPYEG